MALGWSLAHLPCHHREQARQRTDPAPTLAPQFPHGYVRRGPGFCSMSPARSISRAQYAGLLRPAGENPVGARRGVVAEATPVSLRPFG